MFALPSHAPAALPAQSRSDVEKAAKDAGAARAASTLLLRGRSENPDLRLGTVVDASAEGLGSDNLQVESLGKYRVVSLTHEVDYAGSYTNSFTAVPHALELPPPNPHVRAQLGQPELAEVIDVQDPQKLGRLRVRYYWPVQKPADAESTWLRVLTPYAGDGKGQLFTPEVGSQVLVHYEQHRPEQPVVMGNLFHPQNKQGASYTRPQNNLKGLQTAGGNKLVFHEARGAQTILISNANNKGTAIQLDFKGDGSVSIKSDGPISLTAGGDITLESAKNIALRAGQDITLAAQKNVSVQAREENVAVRAQKELLLTAVSDDLTLEAASKKFVAKAADDIEIKAAGVAKINGQDLKLNQPG